MKLTVVLNLLHREFHFVEVFAQTSLRMYQIKLVPGNQKKIYEKKNEFKSKRTCILIILALMQTPANKFDNHCVLVDMNAR
jgi:hypothetical protein